MADIDITNKAVVEQIINEIDTEQNRQLKEDAFKAHEVLEGNQLKYTKLELQRLLPKSWQKMRYSDISISKKVVRKLGKSYKSEPIRSLSRKASTKSLNNIYKEAKANKSFKEFDKLFNLHRHVLMWINYRKDVGKYQFMPLAPYLFNVVRDQDTGELDVVILNYPDASVLSNLGDPDGQTNDSINQLINDYQLDSSANSEVYVLWSRGNHVAVRISEDKVMVGNAVQIKKSVDFLSIPGNPDMVNPLGVIPFVYLSAEMAVDNPIKSPLTQQSITFNTLWSDVLSAASGQGFGILTLKYPASLADKMENVTVGLTTGIELPQHESPGFPSTEAAYINPNPDLAGQVMTYSKWIVNVLDDYGISSSQALDGGVEKFASGLDRIIAQADVQDVIVDNQTEYVGVEDDVFNIVRINEKEIVNSNVFTEKDELTVIYPKPKVLISDKETLENIEKRIALGFIEPWEGLVMLDPNMTETAAREKIELIEKAKIERMEKFGLPPIEEDGDDKEEEEDKDADNENEDSV